MFKKFLLIITRTDVLQTIISLFTLIFVIKLGNQQNQLNEQLYLNKTIPKIEITVDGTDLTLNNVGDETIYICSSGVINNESLLVTPLLQI